MNSHVTLLGALMIGFGIVGLCIGAFVFFLLSGIGWVSGEAEAMFVLSGIGTLVATIFAVPSIPTVIAGIGLLKRFAWSRILALIVAALHILNFPFGTALAGYAIWVLTRPGIEQEFDDARPPATQAAAVAG